MAISQVPDTMDEIDSQENREVLFPRGLPGFTDLRRFHLLRDPAYSPPFEYLASDEDASVGFYLIDPELIAPGYSPVIPAVEVVDLETDAEEDIAVRAIVTIGQSPETTTANLAAPVLFNFATGIACQAILEDARYDVHTPLIARAE